MGHFPVKGSGKHIKHSTNILKPLCLGLLVYGFVILITYSATKITTFNISVNIKQNIFEKLYSNVSASAIRSSTLFSKNQILVTDVGVRRTTCDLCIHHNFKYVIQNKQICNNRSIENIDLLILILTRHKNKEARSALRSTWLSYTRNNTGNVRYAFLLGEISDGKLQKAVLEESRIFHDIIKEDFVDTYMNLTYKTIMGFKWASTQCAHARYVMKTDDDMFVNIPNLLKMFTGNNSTELQTSVFGSCRKQPKPNRNKQSKWFASVKSFPEEYYPGFCSGTGYVASMKVVTAIHEISPSVPFFHLEDVYIALCVRNLGFNIMNTIGFHNSRQTLDPCTYHGKELITSHQLTPTMMLSIWGKSCLRS